MKITRFPRKAASRSQNQYVPPPPTPNPSIDFHYPSKDKSRPRANTLGISLTKRDNSLIFQRENARNAPAKMKTFGERSQAIESRVGHLITGANGAHTNCTADKAEVRKKREKRKKERRSNARNTQLIVPAIIFHRAIAPTS